MQAETEYTTSDLERLGQKWLERIRLSEKREQEWADTAESAERAFLAGRDGTEHEAPEFNIVHSNVETIVPAVYNSAGKPDIRPRHNNKDALGKVVSDILERSIMAMVDDSRMAAEVEASAQDVFVAGRGIVRIKFDADVAPDPMTGEQSVTNERVKYEVVSWRDFRMGPASRWDEVPWVAFRHCLSQEALEGIEDPKLADLQPDPENVASDEDVHIWEIWCRDTGKVYKIVAENHRVLSVKPDPLALSGFFPCAAPVQPITATGKMIPVCPYEVYRTLAEELDQITSRIRGLTEVLKAKGAIAGDTGDLDALAQADDGEIVPLADMENVMAQGGLERAIMWWPIDRIIQVIRELNAQREQTKQVIYEITGISDIIRGATSASETATAQQIKTQWGSLRIKKMQRLIERQVRELFVMTAEIISSKFSIPTLQKLAGMEIPQEAMVMLQAPLDHYRIDVESDSTVRADLEGSRREMSEFLQGTAQFFSAMAPIVAQAPEAAGPVVEMYSSFARQFNLGRQAEDALDQFGIMAQQAASQPRPDPNAAAQQAEQAKAQADMQGKQMDMQARQAEKQADVVLKREEMTQKGQLAQVELALKERELALKEREVALNEATAAQDFAMRQDQAKTDAASAQGELAGNAAELVTVLAAPLQQALAPLIAMVMQADQRQAGDAERVMAAIAQSNSAIAAAMMAPKEIVRDADGRAMGVRTALLN
jgi:hypothetical protein